MLSDNRPLLVPLDGSSAARKSRCGWQKRLLIWRQTEIYRALRVVAAAHAGPDGAADRPARRMGDPRHRLQRRGRSRRKQSVAPRRRSTRRAILMSTHGQRRQPGHAGRPRHAARPAGPALPCLRAPLGAGRRHAGAPAAPPASHRRAAGRQLRVGALGRGGVDAGIAVQTRDSSCCTSSTARPETERAPASPVFVDYPRYELEAWQDEFLRSSFAIAGRPPRRQYDRRRCASATRARRSSATPPTPIATCWSRRGRDGCRRDGRASCRCCWSRRRTPCCSSSARRPDAVIGNEFAAHRRSASRQDATTGLTRSATNGEGHRC